MAKITISVTTVEELRKIVGEIEATGMPEADVHYAVIDGEIYDWTPRVQRRKAALNI